VLTIFSTPKPFKGHEAIIQKNAIKSWTLLRPQCEVILIGDEDGSLETARELNIRHEPNVYRNEHGAKYLNHIFEHAQQMASHDLLCYVNCDIILADDFIKAVQKVYSLQKKFLMVGKRWDLDINDTWDFDQPRWEENLRSLALTRGRQQTAAWIDYFVFTRGTFQTMPPFVIGRIGWDNWLIWKARSSKIPVIDCSSSIVAIHQNHNYAYHPQGRSGVWEGEEARRNLKLAGGRRHIYHMSEGTHYLTPKGLRPNYFGLLLIRIHSENALAGLRNLGWEMLSLTRPIRHGLGLNMTNYKRIKARFARND